LRIRPGQIQWIVALLLVMGAAVASADPSGGPMKWRRDELWDIFWAPRWLDGLTLPPQLTLDQARSGVQSRIIYDPALDRIVASMTHGDVAVVPPRLFTAREYSEEMTRTGFNRTWREETSRTLHSTADGVSRKKDGLVNFDLPFQLPKGLSSIFGEGAPNLRVSGSEQITIGGTSSWRVDEQQREGRQRSKFPTLEMRQQLNVRLNGTIGDKLHIDINQNSEASTSLENQIKIYYQGYDDDVVQRVDLGNTNLSLPRTQYISYSARQEGLFGVKMTGRLADWDFTAIASKQEGQSDVASFSGGSRETQIGGDGKIYDYQFEPRKYFFLIDPDSLAGIIVESQDLAVYLNTRNNEGDNREGEDVEPAIVTLDGSLGLTGPRKVDQFEKLVPNEDYFFVTPERSLSYPYLVMRNSLSKDYTLAVSYQVRDGAGTVIDNVGNFWTRTAGDTLQLKMIHAAHEDKNADLRVGPWSPTRRLELKNIYNLGVRNIDPETFNISIRFDGNNDPPDYPLGDVRVPYLEIVGLDLLNNLTQLPGPDGLVDPHYIDYENGILFFPDLRPFDRGDPARQRRIHAAPGRRGGGRGEQRHLRRARSPGSLAEVLHHREVQGVPD
jgi:hypothetical protein